MKKHREIFHEVTDLTARRIYARDVEPDEVDAIEIPNRLRSDGLRLELERRVERNELPIFGGDPFDGEVPDEA